MRTFASNVYRGGIAPFHQEMGDGTAGFNSLNIAALITEGVWTTVGPIGSGADVETDAFSAHGLPQKGIIGIRGFLLTSNRWSASGTVTITVNAAAGSVLTPVTGSASRVYSNTEYPGGTEVSAEGSQRDTEIIIPVDKDRIAQLRWSTSGTGNFAVSFTPTAPVF